MKSMRRPTRRRPPHWLTLAVSALVAAAMLMVNVGRFRTEGQADAYHGWPLTYLQRTATSDDADSFAVATTRRTKLLSFNYLGLLLNVCLGVLLAASSGFAVERIARRANLPTSVRLTTLLALMGFAGTCVVVVPGLPWDWPDALRTAIWFVILAAIGTLWLSIFELAPMLLRISRTPPDSNDVRGED
ncbi:MAG: hypothetical protein RIC55_30500 [Pirellulaceae bacterium]